MMFKDDQLIFRCFECKQHYKKDFNKDLIKRFASVYEFCNRDSNKFILLFRKGVYPFEYIWIAGKDLMKNQQKRFLQQSQYGRHYR